MIGERLAEIRKDHHDTQTTLAKKLHVAVSSVRNWEQENSAPSHEMLVTICRLYQVSSDYLLGLTDEDPAYIQRQRKLRLTAEELVELKRYESYLLWKKRV